MRLAYCCEMYLDEKMITDGITRKIVGQLTAFINCGYDAAYCFPERRFSLIKYLQFLPAVPSYVNWESLSKLRADVYYFRRPQSCNGSLINMMKTIRSKSPNALILYEIPSYPYDNELLNPRGIPFLLQDRYHRRHLAQYVDRVVSPAQISDIFGIKSIQMLNGYDLKSVVIRTPLFASDKQLNIICIANYEKWHGIDRFIAGMKNYYNSGGARKIVFHVVGDGPALNGLKKQARCNELSDYVVFHGRLGREGMDEVYDQCSLAVECLGMHRRDPSMVSSSLKSREYLAKGIPFIYSAPIDVFEKDPVDFCLRMPADDGPIDIQSVIDFHDRLYEAEPEEHVVKRIRAYAEGHVSWDVTMRPVIDYIKQNVRK